MQSKITKRLLEGLVPKPKLYGITDTELSGFFVRVQPTGSISFYYQYRNANGSKQTLRLGNFPGLQPEGARRLAESAAGQVADRKDPQAEKKAAKVEHARAQVSTLGSFIDNVYEPWALQHLRRGDVAVARLNADFAQWLKTPLSSFNRFRMETWRNQRLKSGTKPVTINRQIATLRACLQHAVNEKVLTSHPLSDLKKLKVENDERVRYLTEVEERRLREALVKREGNLRASRDRANDWRRARAKKLKPARVATYVDHLHPIVLLVLNTGLRRGEVFSLKWPDIDLTADILTVRAAAAKSGKSRRISLNAPAKEVLEAWLQQSAATGKDDLVFPGVDGARLTNVNKSWFTTCALAKLNDFRFHDLRHSFASKLAQRGVDLYAIGKLLGHSSIKMTERYTHLTSGNLSAAVAKLA